MKQPKNWSNYGFEEIDNRNEETIIPCQVL